MAGAEVLAAAEIVTAAAAANPGIRWELLGGA